MCIEQSVLNGCYRLDTINSLPPNIVYKSASQTAIELVPALREQGAELIIAVTHQREPNDNKLAEKVPPGLIDIILGGHDHYYAHSVVNGIHVLRSGSDFKQLSYLEAWRKPDGSGWDFDIIRRDVVRSIPVDKTTEDLVTTLTSALKSKLDKPIGYTASPLDGRFTTVRTRESNLGNFVCDLMRYYYDADCALMAAGTIRGDQVYPPGIIRLKDILNCFPFEDPVVVLKVQGKDLVEALENGVSQVPALEGRFPQVSNITFEFNPSAPPGSRISWAKVGGEPIDPERYYKLATRGYMSRGKDGYTSLLTKSQGGHVEELVSEENGMLISAMLRQYFMSLKVMGKWRRMSKSLDRHWGGVMSKFHGDGALRTPSPRVEKSAAAFWGKDASTSTTSTTEKATATATTTTRSTIAVKASSARNHLRPKIRRYGRYLRNSSKTSSSTTTASSKYITSDDDETATTTTTTTATTTTTSVASSVELSTTSIAADSIEMDTESDSDPEILTSTHEETNYVTTTATSADDEENRLRLARKAVRKWMRIAGVQRQRVGCVPDAAEELTPSWTQGIAPRVEGRIRQVETDTSY